MTKTILIAGQESGNVKNKSEKIISTLATLSSGLAHEIRNNLTTINTCAALAELQITNIKKTSTATNQLLNNLQLQIKHVIADKPATDFELCSISDSIHEAIQQQSIQGDLRGLIAVEPEKDFKYLGNVTLTNHILSNLIRNSLRAIKNSNRGTITIRLELGEEANKLIFRDTATGIPKSFLPKIFDLFESQSTSQGGTGVGLAFCKETMESYGGNIECASTEGEFTEFTLTFPAPKSSEAI